MTERPSKSEAPVIDACVGDITDVEETALTINSQEIQAAAISAAPLHQRRRTLLAMKCELEARMITGKGRELTPLVEEIEQLLDRLDEKRSELIGAGSDTLARRRERPSS